METYSPSTPRVLALHHIAHQTDNMECAIRFYTSVLGGELTDRRRFKKRELAWIVLAGIRIELFSKRDGETLVDWNDKYSGPVHLALTVKNLDEFIQHATQQGFPLHSTHPLPFTPPIEPVVRIAYLLGPDGEEVELRSCENE